MKNCNNNCGVSSLANSADNLVDSQASSSSKPWFPARFFIVLLGMLGGCVMFAVRMNLSVAIIAMVNETAVRHMTLNSSAIDIISSSDNETTDEIPLHKLGRFVWSQSTQGLILGAYYYGYALTQPFTGTIAANVDCVKLVSVGMFLSIVLSFVQSMAADVHVGLLIAVRLLMGCCHGPYLTCTYIMFISWTSKTERASALAVGGNLGTCIALPLTAYLCQYGFGGGYPSAFYVIGLIALAWTIVWQWYATSTPETNKFISSPELAFLKENTDCSTESDEPRKTPWRAILTSMPVWTSIVVKGCQGFGYMVVATKLPAYLEEVLHIPMHLNGYINAAVFISVCVSMCMAGPLSDFLYKRKYFSLTTIRKIFQVLSNIIPATCLVMIPLTNSMSDEDTMIVVCVLLVIAMFGIGLQCGGENPIIGEFAPDFAGYIFGIANTVGASMGFVAPLVVGFLLDSGNGWDVVFYLSGVFFVISAISFLLFAKSEVQPWAMSPTERKKRDAAA